MLGPSPSPRTAQSSCVFVTYAYIDIALSASDSGHDEKETADTYYHTKRRAATTLNTSSYGLPSR